MALARSRPAQGAAPTPQSLRMARTIDLTLEPTKSMADTLSSAQLTRHQVDVAIPGLAKDYEGLNRIQDKLQSPATQHRLLLRDSRDLSVIADSSVHLVVTSPPYWNLKQYAHLKGQLGIMPNYQAFVSELAKVWRECYRVLVPGGRLIIVVGDVCLSRRGHGRHRVVPLHSDIQLRCAEIGFDNLAPIIWYKIAHSSHEVKNGTKFLGKPYEPNGIIKNDIEFILMERKPGGYRTADPATRLRSVIPLALHRTWFRQIWDDVSGRATESHPATFPTGIPDRLIRMFSFVGDTVLDPFAGTGTTLVAAARAGRNSIGVDVDPAYVNISERRLKKELRTLDVTRTVSVER